MLRGDLLEVEGRFFIESGEVFADFFVWWRHPSTGIGGVYRGAVTGWASHTSFDYGRLAQLTSGVVEDAAYDFQHEDAYFARDLRIMPVRDTTAPETRAALRAGPPYPARSGSPIY
jgi:hypothetical protein